MTDVFRKDQRSSIMRAVKSSKNRSTEIALIHVFKKLGIKGWRRNYRLFGNPDFVFPKLRVVVFADGCFWHGHNCRNVRPKNNKKYWLEKIDRNTKRDKLVNYFLKRQGWKVFRILECAIKKRKLPSRFVKILLSSERTL